MSDWALDPATGDLMVSAGKAGIATGNAAVLQDWRLRLATLKGNWFRDRNHGMDPDVMLGKLTPQRRLRIRDAVRTVTLKVRRIKSVLQMRLDLDRQTRRMTVAVLAKLDDGSELELITDSPLGLVVSDA